MNRFRFARSGLGTLRLLVAWLACVAAGASQGAASRPNLVFVLSDDHRADALSGVGHPVVETPHLDRLAAEGVRFENAFVTTSLCSPSRASFLTGLSARRHGVRNNLTPWREENVTFLERLHDAGYATAFIGKWHMPGELPRLRGVDLFVTFTTQGGQGQYFDCPLIVNGEPEPSRKTYITEELTDRAIEFLEEPRDSPFCVVLSHKAVHHQFSPPPDLAGIYANAELPLPAEADSWIGMRSDGVYTGFFGPWERSYRNYLEAVHALDRETGRLLRAIDDSGLREETVVIYASDNGYFWGEHRLLDKRWAYEESIRVPWIVRAPGTVREPGRVESRMVLNLDLAPTLLELGGVARPEGLEGRSLVPLLASPSEAGGAEWRKDWLYEYFLDFPVRVPPMRAIRTEGEKLVDYGRGGEDEFFDLARDPREQHNAIDEPANRARVAELRARLEELAGDDR